jgi:hypothetical protein
MQNLELALLVIYGSFAWLFLGSLVSLFLIVALYSKQEIRRILPRSLKTVAAFMILTPMLAALLLRIGNLLPAFWPTVQGNVVNSTVVSEWGWDDDSVIYGAEIYYTYEVDDRGFLASDLIRAGRFADAQAADIADTYQNSESVDVFYNPRIPEDSYLPQPPKRIFLVFVASSDLLLLGIVIQLVWLTYAAHQVYSLDQTGFSL